MKSIGIFGLVELSPKTKEALTEEQFFINRELLFQHICAITQTSAEEVKLDKDFNHTYLAGGREFYLIIRTLSYGL